MVWKAPTRKDHRGPLTEKEKDKPGTDDDLVQFQGLVTAGLERLEFAKEAFTECIGTVIEL